MVVSDFNAEIDQSICLTCLFGIPENPREPFQNTSTPHTYFIPLNRNAARAPETSCNSQNPSGSYSHLGKRLTQKAIILSIARRPAGIFTVTSV
uniref:Uncharacterized protein n=1 Tax=Onchocerca volvulus TaxID=6282 RepID=A0A8R1TLD0_ONCVO